MSTRVACTPLLHRKACGWHPAGASRKPRPSKHTHLRVGACKLDAHDARVREVGAAHQHSREHLQDVCVRVAAVLSALVCSGRPAGCGWRGPHACGV